MPGHRYSPLRLMRSHPRGETWTDKPFSAAGASLMFPRDPSGPAAETVNCGCQSLPWMESWEVQHPGRKAFSEEEIARNPIRAEL